ncbi:MAG: ABC transporter permease [Thermaerobacter sp.]|nr:ABC transporter permease [Thermaerobacter sp.]
MTEHPRALEAQPRSTAGLFRASWAAAWLEYKGLRLYPANLWLAAAQELTTVGVWYFVSLFLSPVANGVVTRYGGNYVDYVLIGVLLNQVAVVALNAPFKTLSEAFWDKRLETYRLAVQGIWANLVGRLAWQVWFATVLQGLALAVLVTSGLLRMHHVDLVSVLAAWLLLVLANAGLGLMGASLFFLLEVKKGQDPITWIYGYLIQIVTGLYVPVAVLPGWLAALGRVLPQTYAFHVMRLAMLSGTPVSSLIPALIGLALGAVVTMGLGVGMMHWALRRAERTAGLGVVV